MNSFLETVKDGVAVVNGYVNNFVWGIPALILLVGTGIFFTIGSKFFQITHFGHWMRETFLAIFKKKSVTSHKKSEKSISQFQALTTALAATIGTGNIAGVATAIAIGGPGAIFWMWISAIFGMMTNFSENVLGIFYRRKNNKGEWSGGAMYYISDGLGQKKHMKIPAKILAVLFSCFCILASFGIGNMSQINSISDAMKSNFHISSLITGIVLAAVAALVIVGGIKRIATVTEKLVPFMAVAYIVGALIIFITNYKQIPYVFGSIFSDAFNFAAIGGGVGGYVVKRAVTMGFKRGVFSNEAGLGSSVMVHSASNVKEPVKQGMWGIFEVFFDTIIVCTLTSFVLLSSSAQVQMQAQLFDSGLTTSSQYFTIADHIEEGENVPLIDAGVNYVAVKTDNNGKAMLLTDKPESDYIPVNVYGSEYYLECVPASDESDYIYTNIMSIKANAETDKDGKQITDENGNPKVDSVTLSEINGVSLVTYAFSQRFGDFAGKFLSIAILLFAFSTVLGWSFYGTKAVEYLFGSKSTILYKVIFVLFIVVGATMNLSLAWELSDTFNGLMAIPNLIGLLLMSKTVFAITKNYIKRRLKNEKVEPMLSYDPEIQKEQADSLSDGE